GVRAFDLDLHVEAPGTQDRGVDQVLAVGSPDHDHVLQGLDPVELREQLRDDRRLDTRGDARAPGPEDGVHLVEEHDHGETLFAPLLGSLEDLADLSLRLTHVLVQELRTLDVEEVAPSILPAGPLGDLLRERLGDRLGDQGLAAAGRPVEQDALRRLELVLVEQFRIEERQLDRVTDRLDLALEPPDVLVTDIRNLLEHELLDLFLREELGDDYRPRVEQHVVARAHRVLEEVSREVRDVHLVAATEDQRPVIAQAI